MGVMVFIIFFAVFALFLFWLFSTAEGAPSDYRDERVASPRTPQSRLQQARASQTHSSRAPAPNTVAQAAMRRAGYGASPNFVQVSDLGLLAYREDDEPKIVRTSDVLMDTDYLRPFVELWLPHRSQGHVRFELLDSENRLRYADERHYNLNYGRNTLLPQTWLPLRGKAIVPGDWQIRVTVGETVLAVHRFGWRDVGGGVIQRYVHSDGELSPELLQLARASQDDSLSLSDLLADQES